ncbi:hypothetical protein SLA2020_271040 [Shorea laevis]
MEVGKCSTTPRDGNDHQQQPRDTYKIAYIIHFLLGAGNLLPWNALITAVDYFAYLYPTKHVEKTGLVTATAPVTAPTGRQRETYGVTVASVIVCGLADGLVGGSLIGSAGKLPKEYMQAVFAGTASSGVLVSILRIVTKASLPQTPKGLRTSAHLYFIVGTVILLCCIISCNLLYNLPVMQQHHNRLVEDVLLSRPKFWSVAGKIRWPAFGIFLIYLVTLSIFPGFLAENLESKFLGDWYPILLITMYNVADLLGKSLTAIYLLNSIRLAAWNCIARLLFYPLFTACLHGPKWLKTEIFVVTLTFMLGLSNGYLTSVFMILAPKSVPVSEAEISAIVMVVFLGLGLVAGSVLGWFWII